MLAKKYGYYSSDPDDCYINDWACDTVADFLAPVVPLLFKPEITEEDANKLADIFKNWNKIVNEMHSSLPTRPYFGGTKPQLADIMIFQIYANVVKNLNFKYP